MVQTVSGTGVIGIASYNRTKCLVSPKTKLKADSPLRRIIILSIAATEHLMLLFFSMMRSLPAMKRNAISMQVHVPLHACTCASACRYMCLCMQVHVPLHAGTGNCQTVHYQNVGEEGTERGETVLSIFPYYQAVYEVRPAYNNSNIYS